MPEGRHLFRGAHDREWLTQSVQVKAKLKGSTASFRVRSRGVGHHLPSGDLFRNMTLELQQGQQWTEIDRIGRDFDLVIDEETTEIHKELVSDTSLRPGIWRDASAEGASGQRWRLRYHYGSANDEHRGMLTADELVFTLREGVL